MNIEQIVRAQREYFLSGATRPVERRMEALRRLRREILEREDAINAALKQDLNKSPSEAYMTEVGMVLDELRCQLGHVRAWSRERMVQTPMAQFPSRSFVSPEPYGVALVMAPWNYPFQLSLDPLVGALAAGNCVVLKPSAYAPATSQVIADLVAACFPPEYVAVVQGGRQENQDLLRQRFDTIFFTGGVTVGRLVMESAAKYLTPVTLELGGKSPCIVDSTADIALAARRIAFGKFLNAGQTCVAPDYLLVQRDVQEPLIAALQEEIRRRFGEDPLACEYLPRIVNEKHMERLKGLLQGAQIVCGGQTKGLRMAPTILTGVTRESPVMQEEIFGPILPVIPFDALDEVVEFVHAGEKPLALYLFTKDRSAERRVLDALSFGGGCINDTIIHLATTHMGFGGVGQSGMGSYHGRRSFETFSHMRSIVKKACWLDLPMRYPPYSRWKDRMVRMFLR